MSPRVEARLPGIVVVALGAVFCAGALSYGVVSGGRMGPGLMPMVAGVALLVLGLMLTLTGSESDLEQAPAQVTTEVGGGDGVVSVAPTEGETVEVAPGPAVLPAQEIAHPRRPWMILGITAGALVLSPYLGLIPGLALMALVLMRFIERESWRLSLALTVALVLFGWFVFEKFLNVTLPWGVFGGLV